MNKLFLFFATLTIANVSISQTKALTGDGKEVVLYDNGTWKYSETDGSVNKTDSLALNPQSFVKTSSATFLVKSKVFNVGVYLDPSKWTFSTSRGNEKNPEYRFSLKSGEGYTMMITEKTPINLDVLRKVALINAQKAAIDAREISAEYRTVNNQKVLCLKMEATAQGIPFTYLGYYYSNANGTVQLVAFTSQQFFRQLEKELETFLNGFVEYK